MGQNLTVETPGGDSFWDLERCCRVNHRGLLRSGLVYVYPASLLLNCWCEG